MNLLKNLPVVIGGKGIGGIPGIDIGGKLEKFGIFERLGKPAGGGIPEKKNRIFKLYCHLMSNGDNSIVKSGSFMAI